MIFVIFIWYFYIVFKSFEVKNIFIYEEDFKLQSSSTNQLATPWQQSSPINWQQRQIKYQVNEYEFNFSVTLMAYFLCQKLKCPIMCSMMPWILCGIKSKNQNSNYKDGKWGDGEVHVWLFPWVCQIYCLLKTNNNKMLQINVYIESNYVDHHQHK